MSTEAEKFPLTIEFPSDAARRTFALWMCDGGDQMYWDCHVKSEWLTFNCHHDGKFLGDNTIRTSPYPKEET